MQDNGSPGPASPEQRDREGTGLQEVPSPYAERTGPWSAGHLGAGTPSAPTSSDPQPSASVNGGGGTDVGPEVFDPFTGAPVADPAGNGVPWPGTDETATASLDRGGSPFDQPASFGEESYPGQPSQTSTFRAQPGAEHYAAGQQQQQYGAGQQYDQQATQQQYPGPYGPEQPTAYQSQYGAQQPGAEGYPPGYPEGYAEQGYVSETTAYPRQYERGYAPESYQGGQQPEAARSYDYQAGTRPTDLSPGQPWLGGAGYRSGQQSAQQSGQGYGAQTYTGYTSPPPTADEFAQRRAHRPQDPEATMGARAFFKRATFGLIRPSPGRKEREYKEAVRMVRRNFGGLRQITVVNPKGGAGKTVAALMTGMVFGQQRGGYVLAWDNNETQGTLGMRAQPDFHNRTVRDLMADLEAFRGLGGRVGDLSGFVRAQGEAMFDVLASDESATAGEMLTANAFREIREVVSRFYKLIIVDTGNNVRAENWQAAIDATDQLIVTMSARGDSAETAARMLDHLEQTGRDRLVRRAVSVVSMPASRKGLDLPAIRHHFAARTRGVYIAPYEPLLDSGEPIRYEGLTYGSRSAWLTIAAAVAEGL